MKISLVIAFIGASAFSYAQQATSVADLAKSRATSRHATRVITDDDIASSSVAAEPANGAARPEATGGDQHVTSNAQGTPPVALDDKTLAAVKQFAESKTVQ